MSDAFNSLRPYSFELDGDMHYVFTTEAGIDITLQAILPNMMHLQKQKIICYTCPFLFTKIIQENPRLFLHSMNLSETICIL